MGPRPSQRVAGLLGLLAAASACGAPSPESRLDAYRDAVARVVAPQRAAPETEAPRLPGRRERRLEVGDYRIGLLDALNLQECRLGELVVQRNTLLGRVMVPSRRLVYELEVLEAADVCLPELDDRRSVELGELMDRKRAELPRHVWNAVWEKSELCDYLLFSGGDPAW